MRLKIPLLQRCCACVEAVLGFKLWDGFIEIPLGVVSANASGWQSQNLLEIFLSFRESSISNEASRFLPKYFFALTKLAKIRVSSWTLPADLAYSGFQK